MQITLCLQLFPRLFFELNLGRLHCLHLSPLLILRLSDFDGFESGLDGEESEKNCEHDKNDDRWESHENNRTDLRASQRSGHHDGNQVVIDDNHVMLVGVALPKVHKESHKGGEED